MDILKLLKPRHLKPGDTIGIIAPSSPFDETELAAGRDVLHRFGFLTRAADGLFDRNGYLAGGDVQRAAQVHQMFTDNGVQAVMCARGGYGALRILPLLDYALIARFPKAFIGFSDISGLHQALLARTGLVSFHGPMVCSLGRGDKASQNAWARTLMSPEALDMSLGGTRVIRPGSARGRMMGGNLATLCHLLGTAYVPVLDGAILLLEDINEAPYRLDRMLSQMKLAGVFKGVAAVLAGTFDGCGPEAETDRIIEECFADMPIPVLTGFGVGHGDRNLTMPLGVQAHLDTGKGELTFLESAFCE